MRYAALVLLATACGAPDLAWSFTIDDTVRPNAAWIEAEIVEGGCEGEVIHAQGFAPGAASMTPPPLGPGTYGFRVRVNDAACMVIGEGCVVVVLPTSDPEVTVPVAPVTGGSACDAGRVCSSGRCEDGDAGMPFDGGACDGCFDGTECVDGNAVDACGSGGDPCEVCSCTGDTCEAGRCVPAAAGAVDTVAAGNQHTCATANGTLYCWGSDGVGELGDGLGASVREQPMTSDARTDWTLVSTANKSNCGLRGAGVLECWGSNNYGQLGLGAGSPENVGAVTPAVGPSQWDWVSAGTWHTVAIDPTGALYCWGHTANSSCARMDVAEIPDPQRIGTDTWDDACAGLWHTCAIRGGELYCWGVSFDGETGTGTTGMQVRTVTRVGTASDWEEVTCGTGHTCARRVNGTVYCFGCGDDNCYEGYEEACGYDPNPTDATIEGDCSGKLGTGMDASSPVPIEIAGGLVARTIDARTHTCLITRDVGALYCWGPNEDGQLGVGDTVARNEPTLVSRSGWFAVEAGRRHTCAIRDGGALYCWGQNEFRQLGTGGPTTDALRPARVCMP